MSGEPDKDTPVKRDDPLIAAEWSLGLLEGEELLAARGKHAVDPDFAWRKEWWDNWFAPLADEIAAAEPSPQLWERITAAVNTPAEPMGEIIQLRERVKRWRVIAALTSAAAAIALMLNVSGIVNRPATEAPALAAAPLVATVPIGDAGLGLDVTYIPQSEQMLISAAGLTADGVHDHELWLVPRDGSAVQSLGVIAPGTVRGMALPADVTSHLADGAQLLLTREPLGGKPAGAEPGPVVAKGAFAPV
jgi:anti-sigma-K factor RskA